MTTHRAKKIIAAIGGTGAQGRAVVQALLADGDSHFAVRILTRSTTHPLAQELSALGAVELVEGAIQDPGALALTLDGAYGAFVNTDSFTLGEAAELHAGVRVYEAARRAGVRHFVWSSLEYKLKENGYDERYDAPHYSAKGRVWEFVKSQAAQDAGGDRMMCTALVTGPYMESLSTIYGPIGQRKSDGAFVFANPWTDGQRFPFVALRDIGFFARWIFDNRGPSSAPSNAAEEIRIMSQFVSPADLTHAFLAATGKKAVFVPLAHEEFIASLSAAQPHVPHGGMFAEVFRAGLRIWTEPGQLVRDMEWIRSLNPETRTVEAWMRETGYTGEAKAAASLLKAQEGAEEAPRVLSKLAHLLE